MSAPLDDQGSRAARSAPPRAVRALPWMLAAVSAALQALGVTASGHVLWIAEVPWALALMLVAGARREAPWRLRAWGLSAFTGAFGALCLWGIAFYAPGAYAGAVVYIGLWWGLFGFVSTWILRQGGPLAALSSAALWALLEIARSLGSLSVPFFFGGMLADETALAQLAALTGPSGVSLLVLWLNFAIAGALARPLGVARWSGPGTWLPPVAALAAVTAGGWLRLAQAPSAQSEDAPGLRVAALQGSVPSWLYSLAKGSPAFRRLVEAQYGELYREALAGRPAPDVIVFPETAFDWHILPTTEALRSLSPFTAPTSGAGTELVVGASLSEDCGQPRPCGSRNGILVATLDATGRPTLDATLVKRRLVPFVEVAHAAAAEWRLAPLGAHRAGVMICFESLYPQAAAEAAVGGADLLLIASDDGGMRRSPLSRIHAEQARFRAIETGLPLLRAGQAGPSFGVDPYGRLLGELQPWAVGVLAVDLPRPTSPTFFARWGQSWLAVWAALAFAPPAWRALQTRRARRARSGSA